MAWTPQQARACADTVVVETGTVFVVGETAEQVFAIGNTDRQLAPTLDLTDATVRLMTLLAEPPAEGGPAPGEWGTVNVAGDSVVHASVGRFTPAGEDGAAAYQPGFLTVVLAPGATLGGDFDLRNGGVSVRGDATSALDDFRLTVHGTDVNFVATGLSPDLFPVTSSSSLHVPVTGDSAVVLEAGPPDALGRLFGGSMSFRESVGADTTVTIQAGGVGVYNLPEFHATVDLFEYEGVKATEIADPDAEAPSGLPDVPEVAVDLFLRDVQATSWGFDDATHTMTLYNGVETVGQVRFAHHITAGDFHQALGPGDVDTPFVVAAYDNGVDIATFYEADVNQLLPMLEPGII